MDKFYNLVLSNYNNLALFTFLIIIFFFGYNAKDFQLDASSDTLILEQDDDLNKYREVLEDYEASDFLIVTFTDQNRIINQKNLSILRSFIDHVYEYDWVDNVQSIFDAPLLEVNNQSLTDLVDQILTIESPNINLFEAEKELLESPIFGNLLISKDATSTAIIINFKKYERHEFLISERERLKRESSNNSNNYKIKIEKEYLLSKKKFDSDRHKNINDIRNLINKYSDKNLKVHLGGVAMIADDTIQFIKNDILLFGIGALLFILLVLYIVFKSPIWMFACIANCIASLTIMIGTVSILGWKVTVISSNFIMLILILSLSMTVHIVVRYRQLFLENKEINNTDRIILALKKMYRPCLFAALTTIFAFATLYTSGIKPVMDFGKMMCTGLIITYVTSFLFLPILINFLNFNLSYETHRKTGVSSVVNIINKFPKQILLVFLLMFLLGIYGSTKLEVENSFVDYFKKDTEIYKGMKLIDDKLGGTTPLDIIIKFNENDDTNFEENLDEELFDFGIDYDPADYWFTNEKINTIKKLHDHLEQYPFSGKVLSLASIVRTAEKINSNNEFDTLELAILYKKLPSDIKEQIIKPYVIVDKNEARISMRLVDTHPELVRKDFLKNLNKYITNNFSAESTDINITGILVLYNNMLESLFDSQIKSLSIVLFGIFVILIVLFKSIKIAIAAIIPNLIACFVILGTMGLLSIPLDLMTITIAAITIGIAVDNCIHYVYRYREFILLTNNHFKTVTMCDNTVGIAIKNTSYTIIIGFSILVFSNFYPTIYFGIFTALAMFIALIGSLTLLPTLLKILYKV